jgi:hypothetical protein
MEGFLIGLVFGVVIGLLIPGVIIVILERSE